MFIFNEVAHTKTGDVVHPVVTYETELEWKARYHAEMAYAIASEDVTGVDILISDNTLFTVFLDHLRKPTPEIVQETENK